MSINHQQILFYFELMDPNMQTYLNNWQPEFRARTATAITPPTQQRTCKDICCLVFFILVLLAFIILGLYVIITGWQSYNSSTTQLYFPNFSANRNTFLGIVLGMAALSLVISILFVCLLKSCAKCMIYFSIVLVIVAILGFMIYAFILGSIAIGVILIIGLILYLIIFCCCWRQHIDAAIIITRITGKFLSQNFSVYCITIFVALLNLIFLIFLIASIASNIHMYNVAGNSINYVIISIFQGIFYLFFSYYFYYLMVFVIAATVALWYFKNRSQCCTAFGWSFYHIGTLTYASVMITLIKIIQMLVRSTQKRTGNSCADICLCIFRSCVQCCLSCLEGLIKVLNHYAIILAAITGQDYMTSAKSAAVLIMSNLGLFTIVDSAAGFLFFTGILFSLIIPTILGIILAYYAMNVFTLSVATGVIVFFISLIISVIFLATLSESMSSIFVFYSFEQKLVAYGQRNAFPITTFNQDQLISGNFDAKSDPKALLRAAVPLITPDYIASVQQQPFQPVYNQNQGNPNSNTNQSRNYNQNY